MQTHGFSFATAYQNFPDGKVAQTTFCFEMVFTCPAVLHFVPATRVALRWRESDDELPQLTTPVPKAHTSRNVSAARDAEGRCLAKLP